MNYPGYEMGFDSYYIYKKAGNDSISGSDLTTLAGKRVGTLENNLMTDFFETWMEETGSACEEVLFDDFKTRDDAFESGEIDAIIAVNNNVPSNSGMTPVVMVGESSYYLAVTKSRPDLLAELNKALSAISEGNPYFFQTLQIKYFQNTAVNAALSQEEEAWVSDHSVIRVGYLENYIPYCGTDGTGNVSGVITDILGEWEKQLGLSERLGVDYVPYLRYTDMVDALRSGEINTAFPIHDSIWDSEQQGIVQTNDLVESGIHLVYRGEYNENTTTQIIAVSSRSAFQRNYAAKNYPDSAVYEADTLDECLEAVKDGRATCTFFSSGQAEGFLSRKAHQSLNRLTLDESINFCMGVKKGNNVMYSLLSRGIFLIDKSNMTNAMYAYMNLEQDYSLSNFIQEHITLVLSVALVIIGLIVAVAIMLALSLRKTRQQKDKELQMLELVTRQKEELVAAKDRLQEAVERAELASEAKTTFLFNMSHDIRTPMNAIIGYTTLAEKESEPGVVKDYLKKIASSSQHLLALINDVLEMSRIESGKMELEPVKINLQDMLKEVRDMFQTQMDVKNIAYTVDASQVQHPYVLCDKNRLNRVLLNLLSNAYKFTPSGGTVSVSLREADSAPEGYGSYELRVTDSGIGMSREFAETVFEAFTREKTSTVSGIQGTGLGMAITKSIVDLMGGSIDVQTAPNQGTTFLIRLCFPLQNGEEIEAFQSDRTEVEHSANLSGTKVLLVEDNAINREIATLILEESGFVINTAENGKEAVEKIRDSGPGAFDVVLMDIQMPVMNGYEATKAIRALNDPVLRSVPIIAMTANAFAEDVKDAEEAGMNGHIAKPIDVANMIETLKKVLEG